MSYRTFHEWIGFKKDIFGFERKKIESKHRVHNHELPIRPFDSQYLIRELLKTPIGNKQPQWDWGDTVTWGGHNLPESIHVEISPLGSFKVIIRKMINSLIGENVWVCKKIQPLPDSEYLENEAKAVEVVSAKLEGIDEVVDSPSQEYDIEKLAKKLASEIKTKRPTDQMIFHGIRQKNENYYLISMDMVGVGLEAPDQTRVEQFHIHLYFNKEAGLIRCIMNDITSPTRGHRWTPSPAEMDENFAPTQSLKEICDAILAAMSTY